MRTSLIGRCLKRNFWVSYISLFWAFFLVEKRHTYRMSRVIQNFSITVSEATDFSQILRLILVLKYLLPTFELSVSRRETLFVGSTPLTAHTPIRYCFDQQESVLMFTYSRSYPLPFLLIGVGCNNMSPRRDVGSGFGNGCSFGLDILLC